MNTGIGSTLLILEMLLMAASQERCPNTHFQKLYCLNDIVFKARFTNKGNQTGIYTMELQELFKGTTKELDVWGNNLIKVKTQLNLRIRPGDIFVIIGRAENGTFAAINCFGVFPWRKLTSFQMDGLFVFYEKGCDCVAEIPAYSEDLFCHWNHAVFLNDTGHCVWVVNRSLKDCELKHYGPSTSDNIT